MKLCLICPTCSVEERTRDDSYVMLVDQRDVGAYHVQCPKGHEFVTVLQNQKFEILFESGAMALVDGYTREAVSSFAASLERFLEFFCKVVARKNGVSEGEFNSNWKLLLKQSERQLGAYCACYLLEWKKAAPYLENKMTEFRNNVIHRGYIPETEEVIAYGEKIVEFVEDRMTELRVSASEAISRVTFEHLREQGQAHPGLNHNTMLLPMILSSLASEAGGRKVLRLELEELANRVGGMVPR